MLRYIAHRIMVMIPTLLAISVLVFIIIQLPPGDYLTTMINEAVASGMDVDKAKVVKTDIVGSNGKVISATARGMNNPKVETCIARVLKRVKFPRIPNGGTVTVSYPFTFKPAPKRKQK